MGRGGIADFNKIRVASAFTDDDFLPVIARNKMTNQSRICGARLPRSPAKAGSLAMTCQ